MICPSNPLISIGPILAIPGIREVLKKRRSHVVAVCPIVGGKSLKGPSDRMLAQLGHDASAVGVARMYRDICGTMVIDPVDSGQTSAIEAFGMNVVVHPTIMRTVEDKELLARRIVLLGASRKTGAAA